MRNINNSSLPVRRYTLRGGVDVNMYNTLLEPDFALNIEDEQFTDEEQMKINDRFSIDLYRQKVLELAIPLLEQQLQLLPYDLHIVLIPDSVSIFSPHDYSICGDELRFTIEAGSDFTQKQMQQLLDDTVRSDWNAEFGSHYRIYEMLGENYTIYDFLKLEGGEVL